MFCKSVNGKCQISTYYPYVSGALRSAQRPGSDSVECPALHQSGWRWQRRASVYKIDLRPGASRISHIRIFNS